MIEWGLAILTGLVAGVIHVVSGPDHMAAVLPFAVDAPKRSLRLGLLWGVGHGLGVVVLGLIFVAFRQVATVEWISHASELLVGALLVVLGVWALYRSRVVVVHHHPHDHSSEHPTDQPEGGNGHTHPHVHFNDPTVDDARHSKDGRHQRHHHSTMGFGFIHGLAGAGHLVVASPIVALTPMAAALYLGSYLLGGIGAMTAFAYLAGRLVRRPSWIPAALQIAGVSSVVVGVVWMTSFALA